MAASEERRGQRAGGEDRLVALCIDYELGVLTGEERSEIEALLTEGDPEAEEAMAQAREALGAVALGSEPVLPAPI